MSEARRWLATPLAGTAGVMLGLCLLAIPLRKLTSAQPVKAEIVSEETATKSDKDQTPGILRLKLLSPAKAVSIKTADDIILLGPLDLEAGETEHDVNLPFDGEELDLILEAELGDASDSAVFLTVMPDGLEGLTRYVIGSGPVSESLNYEWHVHDP